MVLNFKQLKEDAKVQPVKPLFAIILGPSGAGKSSAMGTLGVPTLFLTTASEHHGPQAARTLGGDITAIDITKHKKDGSTDADSTVANLIEILRTPDLKEHFGAVCIDSANELQSIFRKTTFFTTFCKTDKGGHNSFKEGEADNNQFKIVLEELIKLNAQGLHIVMSCAAIVKSLADDGSVSEASPSLVGFSVAHDLIRNFSDVLLVSRITEFNDETQLAKVSHKFLFKANVSKVSKDLKGVTMKTASFSPRISGFSIEDLPETAEANLAKIIAGRIKKATKTK